MNLDKINLAQLVREIPWCHNIIFFQKYKDVNEQELAQKLEI